MKLTSVCLYIVVYLRLEVSFRLHFVKNTICSLALANQRRLRGVAVLRNWVIAHLQVPRRCGNCVFYGALKLFLGSGGFQQHSRTGGGRFNPMKLNDKPYWAFRLKLYSLNTKSCIARNSKHIRTATGILFILWSVLQINRTLCDRV